MTRWLVLFAVLLAALPAQANETTLAYAGCNTTQQDKLRLSISEAHLAVETAISMTENGQAEAHLIAWFGNTQQREAVLKILRAVHNRLERTDTLTLVCEERSCEHNLMGYVESGGIGVCPDFFASPPSLAYDSQMGTIIHELTHYTSNTEDHAYGTADARRLAVDAPAKAVNNADNYQYYVEALVGLIPDGDKPYNAANACRWAYDGECDEKGQRGTGACQPGTDTADCSRPRASGWQSSPAGPRKPARYDSAPKNDNSCPTAKNGICDEPGRGGNDKCRVGSDISDCDPTYNPKQR
jgi:hypothetical protein